MGIKHTLIALVAAIILTLPCSTEANPLVTIEIDYEGTEANTGGTAESWDGSLDADTASMLHSLDGTDPNADLRDFLYDGSQDYVTVVPEPATIFLLGLSSLALLHKRR